MARHPGGELESLFERMRMSGGARVESFFLEHGLGNAYNKPSKGYGIRKRINEALLEAERQGRLNEVVAAARHRFQETTEEESVHSTSAGDAGGRLFISHASADVELADSLVELLRLGSGLNHAQVLCTSLDGMSIPEGEPNYVEYLRKQVSDAKLVLPLLTPAFFDSDMCLIELGALWVQKSANFPLIVPPITYERVERLLGKRQCGTITKPATLSKLHDRIVELFELHPDTAMWEGKRDKFLSSLDGILSRLAPAKKVPVTDYEAHKQQLAACNNEVERLAADNGKLRNQLKRLSLVKDSDEAAAILEPVDEAERIDYWAEKAFDAIDPLPRAVRNALYEEYGRDECYWPPEGEFSEADDALRDSYLKKYDDDSPYQLNTDNPDVADALDALADLFEREWSKPTRENFKAKHRTGFAKSNRQAWKALDLL